MAIILQQGHARHNAAGKTMWHCEMARSGIFARILNMAAKISAYMRAAAKYRRSFVAISSAHCFSERSQNKLGGVTESSCIWSL